MKKILVVESSPRGNDSVSRKLTRDILEKLKKQHPGSEILYRDLTANPLPHVGHQQILAVYTPPDQRDEKLKRAIELSDRVVDELIGADIVVIGTPIWNFGVPSALKAWIDHIVRAGRTFSFTEQGPKGLVGGKQVWIAVSSGGVFSEGAYAAFDFVAPYLKSVLGFIGITDVRVIRAEGLNDPRLQATAYDKALKQLQEVSA